MPFQEVAKLPTLIYFFGAAFLAGKIDVCRSTTYFHFVQNYCGRFFTVDLFDLISFQSSTKIPIPHFFFWDMCFLHSKAFSGMVGKSSATGKAEELAKLSFGPLHLRDGSDRDGWKVGVGTRGIRCVLEIYRWFDRAVVVLWVPGVLGRCKLQD